jgi:hypothetical protein
MVKSILPKTGGATSTPAGADPAAWGLNVSNSNMFSILYLFIF